MFYSKSTNGFYSREIHGDNIPGDAAEITKAEHASLLTGQSTGNRIIADATGKPVLGGPPKATAAEVWERIKSERDRRKSGGFRVAALWLHSDDASRIQYNTLLVTAFEKSLPLNYVLDPAWKTMDGTFVPMTVDLLRQTRDAGVAYESALFRQGELHKTAMAASADPAAYDFSTGWPAVFAG
jgi:hypothetical protein